MYCCKKCFRIYQCIDDYRIDTLQKQNVFQCDTCFNIDSHVLIHNYNRNSNPECILCLEKELDVNIVIFLCEDTEKKCNNADNNICLYNCNCNSIYHWVCAKCYDIYKISSCPKCNTIIKQGTCINTDNNNKFDNFIDYFKNLEAKPYFKILYAYLVDQINANEKNILYDLLFEYYRFLCLLFFHDNNKSKIKLSPPYLINMVWKKHLIINKNYNKICDMLCGYVLEYYPFGNFKTNIDMYKEGYLLVLEKYTNSWGQSKNKNIWTPMYFDIQIEIVYNKNLFVVMNVNSNIRVKELKQKIVIIKNIPFRDQLLLLINNVRLENDKILEYYKITADTKLFLELRQNIENNPEPDDNSFKNINDKISQHLDTKNGLSKSNRLRWCGKPI